MTRRCHYCGHRCHGFTCQFCTDLRRIEDAMRMEDPYRELHPMRRELREAVFPRRGTEA